MHSVKRVVRDTVLVIIGNAILAFGVAVFAVPSDLIVGGATGLSLIIGEFIPINYASIVFGINMVMLVLGFFVLGKKFAAGTILSSFIFPFFLSLFETIPQFQNITNDILLSAIYAGIFTGVGLGIVFRLGYSTGGMDVPPIILNKRTGISVALAINVLDIMILVGQVFFSSFEGILYGIITVFVSTFVLDQVIVMGEKNLQVFVISTHHEEIADAIFKEIDRGCTFVNVTTGYFHHQQKAVLCVANNREYAKINDLVMNIDPTAFIIGSEIHSVKGRGFTLPNIDLDKQMRDHV
ncbi:YitT family protein [Candidatus Stoquefichus massiliensis]|uniref:YitT family protein n=1 Tax=Candidatus Stoquefichus massiliensis TaxID=1470350 RepID=UPI000484C850|nr:YitT family protein [Candidatus Stoquefichus massiliensis]